MGTVLAHVFSADGFIPHGMCYLWRPEILALQAASVSLIAQLPDNSVFLEVSDNGIGISPTLDLNALCSLGVQLVMTLVEQIDGQLEIIRQPGCTFRIRFPLESRT